MKVEIKIEKGIKIPEPKQPGRAKYPWKEMKVGDSFFREADGKESMRKLQLNLNGCALRQRPFEFTTRQVDESGRTGIRVWRVK